MNLETILSKVEKAVTAKQIFRDQGAATLIKIKKSELLSDHQSRTNAFLILLNGSANYIEENREVKLRRIHDTVEIPEKVTHKVVAEEDSLLLLIQ